jgi:hypothetical protein
VALAVAALAFGVGEGVTFRYGRNGRYVTVRYGLRYVTVFRYAFRYGRYGRYGAVWGGGVGGEGGWGEGVASGGGFSWFSCFSGLRPCG